MKCVCIVLNVQRSFVFHVCCCYLRLLIYICYCMLRFNPCYHFCITAVCVCVWYWWWWWCCCVNQTLYIFWGPHVFVCVCLLPYTQTIILNKDKTLLVPPQMEHLAYWLGCEMDDRGIWSLILGIRFSSSWNHLHSASAHPASCSVGTGDIFHKGKVVKV